MLEDRPQARDDGDRCLRRRKPPQREQTLVHRACGRRARLERHALSLGEEQHPIVAQPSRKLGTPATRAVLTRGDERHVAPTLCDERGPGEGAASRGGLGNDEALASFEPSVELAITFASFGEREDAPEPRGGGHERGGAGGGHAPSNVSH